MIFLPFYEEKGERPWRQINHDLRATAMGKRKGTGEFRSSVRIGTAIIDGNTFAAKAVQYAAVDGMAIVEGDIVLGTVEEMERQTRTFQEAASQGVAHGVAITGQQFRWPNCEIPFEIDPNLPNTQRVTDAIAHWEANTGFRFIPADGGKHRPISRLRSLCTRKRMQFYGWPAWRTAERYLGARVYRGEYYPRDRSCGGTVARAKPVRIATNSLRSSFRISLRASSITSTSI